MAYPILSPDDTFTDSNGSAPNIWRWVNVDGTPDIQSNRLNHVSEDSSKIQSLFEVTGDFDIQADYVITSGDSTATWGCFMIARLVSDPTDHFLAIERGYGGIGHRYIVTYNIGAGFNTDGDTAESGTSLKYRITRTGSNIQGYHWNGSGWDTVGSAQAVGSGAIHMELGAWRTATQSYDVNQDNFTVNSGTIVWPQFASVPMHSFRLRRV